MAKNVNYVSHKKSKQIVDGKPKLPLSSDLVEGEIAINFAENVETLSIKNESGDVVTFSSDNYYTEKKLGSGFTGANSAVTVTDVIEENEEIIATALNDLNKNKLDASAYTPTDLSNYYTKSETSGKTELSTAFNGKQNTLTAGTGIGITNDVISVTGGSIPVDQVLDNTTSASTNPVSSKAVYDAVTDNELVWTNAYVSLSGTVSAHTNDTTIHVTSADKTAWNNAVTSSHTHDNKSALDVITGSVGTMAYENTSSYSSATEVNTALGNKADTATTIAGYGITDAKIANQVITLGSDSITVSSSTQVNTALGNKANASDLDAYADSVKYNSTSHYVEFYHGTTAGTKVFEYDASPFIIDGMVQNVEIKDVTSGESQVTCLVISFNTDAGKQDINVPISNIFDASNYYTKSETSGSTELTTAFSTKANTATTLAGYGITDAYTKSETSGATEISNALGGKVNSATFTGHTADTAMHFTTTEKTNLDSLATNISTISGITSTKVNNWDGAVTNSHTHSNKTYLDGITGAVGTMAYQNTASYSSATEVNTALGGKSDIGHTHTTSIETSTGTNQLTLGFGNKYSLNAGGTSYIFTMPSSASSWNSVTSVTTSSTAGNISVNGSNVAVAGLGGAAYLNTGTTAGTVATGNHNHEASAVTAFTNYQIASSSASVLTTDSLLQVIGKLEKRIQLLETAMGGLKLVKISQTDYDNLGTKDSNTLYVIV